MTRRIRVVVTAEDIEAGKPCRAWDCPLALSLQRLTGNDMASVGTMGWFPEGPPDVPSRGMLRLSKAAQRFVMDVDLNRPVAPATFYLEGPDA